jgi:hypothetical protein
VKCNSDAANPVPPTEEFEHHGKVARALLAIIGAVFAMAGAAMVAVVVFAFGFSNRGPRVRLPLLWLAAFFILLLFAGIAAYGVSLVVRGIRGQSRRRFTRAQAGYIRHWYVVGIVTWGALAGAGMLAAGGPTALLLGPDVGPVKLAWHVLLGFLVLPIHVTFHELGHAAASALVGFRFAALRVGRLIVHREGKCFRVTWSPANMAGVLGLHLGIPEGEKALGVRLAIYAACGPATTLMLAAACRAGASAMEPATTLGSAVASHALLAGWWAGAFLGVVNLLPFRTNCGLITDGARILMAVLPRSPGAEAVMRSSVLSVQGRRPRDWGMSVGSLLSAASSERHHRDTLLVVALAVALDVGDTAGVDEVLRRVAETPPSHPLCRNEVELQAAMVEAFRGDTASARRRLDRLGPHQTIPGYPRLAEAVVDLAEGRPAQARAALEAWEQAIAKTGMATTVRVGNEWAEEVVRARLGLVSGPADAAKVHVG